MGDKISGWVRQARHRAKKYGVTSSLEVAQVRRLHAEYGGKCAYCGAAATTTDHPFPLGSMAPNVAANVLPCCAECKSGKGVNDLVSFFNSGGVDEKKLLELIAAMLARDGGSVLREHIKGVTGIGL